MSRILMTLFVASVVAISPAGARTESLRATLSAQYFSVTAGANLPDFGGTGMPNVAAGSALGEHGFPVVIAPPGIADVDRRSNEITWWSPSLNGAVVATGSGTISLPFASNMYPPNSTGSNDAMAFETAVISGAFVLSEPQVIELLGSSDDDLFVYIDGKLITQLPGIHGAMDTHITSPRLTAGPHQLVVFYADRQVTGAYLSLKLLTPGVEIIPTPVEASTLQFVSQQTRAVGYALFASLLGLSLVVAVKISAGTSLAQIFSHVAIDAGVQFAGLVKLFSMGVLGASTGLVVLVVNAVAGGFIGSYPIKIAAAVILALGAVIAALTLLRAQDVEERYSDGRAPIDT
jgi:fibro-slime domain-containing protein